MCSVETQQKGLNVGICCCCHLPGERQFLQALHPAVGRGSTPWHSALQFL